MVRYKKIKNSAVFGYCLDEWIDIQYSVAIDDHENDCWMVQLTNQN